MAAPVTETDVVAFRLARHRLLPDAAARSAVEVAGSTCGLHAQVISSADLSVWARSPSHSSTDLSRALWEERTLVKTWLMRGTLHVVPSDDLPTYVSALDNRGRYDAAWLRYFDVSADDMHRLVSVVAEVLGSTPLTRAELASRVAARVGDGIAQRLKSGWGEFLKPAARAGVLCFGPSQGQNVTFVRPDRWLSGWREVPQEEAAPELLRRYLRAYGPASADDFDRWVGSNRRTRFRPAWAALEGEIVEVEPKRFLLSEDTEQLHSGRAVAGVRLLPAFDPYLLGHADRAHAVDADLRNRVYRAAGWVSPVVLEGGRVVGVWSQERRRGTLEVTVEVLRSLGEAASRALESEAQRLARYLELELDLRFGPVRAGRT